MLPKISFVNKLNGIERFSNNAQKPSGGHCDGEPDVRAVATRDLHEAPGVKDLAIGSEIFETDVHGIPACGVASAHLHHNIRFSFLADADQPVQRNAEFHAIASVPLGGLRDYTIFASVTGLCQSHAELKGLSSGPCFRTLRHKCCKAAFVVSNPRWQHHLL
ncbi:hypothetical protein GCM10011363_44740 [Marivita lacus]|uniref:Uncharacterized protein n=1 Tax=Marivita lacus TaxID=1323742 RepID=A0ABQ1LEF3_9RHOB|nr:hypothetical protein [Marivita lacus]GGC23333.1 hypothetical protein GCM10011363_44740 [Marivita lacus]